MTEEVLRDKFDITYKFDCLWATWEEVYKWLEEQVKELENEIKVVEFYKGDKLEIVKWLKRKTPLEDE